MRDEREHRHPASGTEVEVRLPKLADTLVEGTVARWHKRRGDAVRKGEPLAEIDTEKVSSDLEAPAEGVLAEVLVEEGATVPVGEVIARIRTEASGPGMAAAPPAATADARAAEAPSEGLSPMRRRIAQRMQQSRATIPQGACVREVDVSRIRRAGASWTAFFVKALASAAGSANVGVAVEVPDGLVVPVVKGSDRSDVTDISAAIADLSGRARDGRLRPEEVLDAVFTVTNVGSVGTHMAFPLVPPGQRAILAPGAVREGRCYLTLCYDRRELDDYAADRLLARIEEELHRLE